MRQLILAGVALTVLTGVAAHAQGKDPNAPKTPLDLIYEQQERDQKQAEKDYNDAMRRTRGQAPQAKNDPWRTIRPSEPAKSKR